MGLYSSTGYPDYLMPPGAQGEGMFDEFGNPIQPYSGQVGEGQPGGGVITPPSSTAKLSYGNNLNYPDYSGGQGSGGALLKMPAEAPKPGAMDYMGAGAKAMDTALPPYQSQPGAQVSYGAGGMPVKSTAGRTMGATGSTVDTAGSAAMAIAPMTGPAAPYVAGVGLGAKVLGKGMQIFSASEQTKEAERNYKKLMAEWERRKRREDADHARELKRQKLQDAYYGAAQAGALEDRFASSYGGYQRGGQ